MYFRELGTTATDRSLPDACPAAAVHRPMQPAARPRHRFVRDGEVPVVTVTSRRGHSAHSLPAGTSFDPAVTSRLETVEVTLRQERSARQRVEAALRAAQATIHDLQTKLGHAVLARDEAVEALRGAEAGLRDAEAQRAEQRRQAASSPTATHAAGPKRRGRSPGSSRKAAAIRPASGNQDAGRAELVASSESPQTQPAKERHRRPITKPDTSAQEPVKWWLAGWRSEFGL